MSDKADKKDSKVSETKDASAFILSLIILKQKIDSIKPGPTPTPPQSKDVDNTRIWEFGIGKWNNLNDGIKRHGN